MSRFTRKVRRLAGAGVVLAVGSAACVLDDVSSAGKPCPCPETLSCDPATQLCVELAGATSGSSNAASSSSSGVAVCAGRCGTPGCSACPTVAQVDGGLGYLIDALEVVRGDYAAFLADRVDPASQSQECKWNTSFAPADTVVSDDNCIGFDLSVSAMAATCVDWCDAKAFCQWAGKRLCGKIGGGSLSMSALNDGAVGEWFAACSNGGQTVFPYGQTYVAEACSEAGSNGELPPGSKPDCQGGFPGLFDMVGNVEEWEDACDLSATPEGDECPLRGGAFWAQHDGPEPWAQCATSGRSADRGRGSHDWGFRCCDDP